MQPLSHRDWQWGFRWFWVFCNYLMMERLISTLWDRQKVDYQ